MLKLAVLTLFAALASQARSEVCRHRPFPHTEYANGILDEVEGIVHNIFIVARQNLQDSYAEFGRKIAIFDLGERAPQILNRTGELANQLRKAFDDGEEEYIRTYNLERVNGMASMEAVSSGVRDAFNSALTKARKSCTSNVKKHSEAKVSEADDKVKECTKVPEQMVRRSVASMSRTLDSVNVDFSRALNKLVREIEEPNILLVSELWEKVSGVGTVTEQLGQRISQTVSSEKEVIPEAKAVFRSCAEGVKSHVKATVEAELAGL